MNHPIRVGIAGLGRSGWDIHVRLLGMLPDLYRVVNVLDADPARRTEAEDRFDCRSVETFEHLIADDETDLIIVALPSHLHAGASVEAMEAGKAVVCEKPMAPTLAEADRMIEAAERTGQYLTVFQNRRYNPEFVQIRKLIESGVLGRIVQIRITESRFTRRWDWQTLKQFGGGTLNNTGPHFLDQALQLFGESEPEVFCHLDRTLTLGDADDHLKILLKGDGAPTIDIEISACDAFPGDLWNIMGTRGGLSGSTKRLEWKYFEPADLPHRELSTEPTPDRSYNRDEIPWQHGSWEPDRPPKEAYADFYRDLYASLREGAPLVITPESVRRVVWLMDRCHTLSPV